MRIAITGATGFLGRVLVRMAAERGDRVVAIARGLIPPGDIGTMARFVAADIGDEASLRTAITGCDVVIHAAALSAPWGRRADFERVNVEGTRTLVAASAAATVRRIVHVSSTSLYFAYRDRFAISEQAPLPPPVNAYAATKRQAEEEIRRFAGEVFIARPRGIFGPGDPHLLPRLLVVARRGPLPLLREGAAIADITFVETIAHALLAMAQAPADRAGTYNIAQGQPIAIRDLVERLLHGLGTAPRWRSLPTSFAFAAARFLEGLARLDPKGREPLVTAYGLGLFTYAQTLDLTRAHDILSWQPPIGLEEALARTIQAFKGRS